MKDPRRELALIEELHTAVGLAQLGLGCLQGISGSNQFYHLPFQLLASGKERLLKIILCVHAKGASGEYPTLREMKFRGHDVSKLLASVTDEAVFGYNWISDTAAGRADYHFLTSDTTYRQIVDTLSLFGAGGRYANLDVIVGAAQAAPDPEDAWKRMESTLLTPNEVTELASPNGALAARSAINVRVQVALERSMRALARWFTLGGGRDEGRRHSGILMPFLGIMDQELGSNTWPGIDTQ